MARPHDSTLTPLVPDPLLRGNEIVTSFVERAALVTRCRAVLAVGNLTSYIEEGMFTSFLCLDDPSC